MQTQTNKMSVTSQTNFLANAHDVIVDAWASQRCGKFPVENVYYEIKSNGEVILSYAYDSRFESENHFTPANEDRLRVWLGMFLRN